MQTWVRPRMFTLLSSAPELPINAIGTAVLLLGLLFAAGWAWKLYN